MMIRKIVTGYIVFVVSGTAGAQGLFDFDDIPGVSQEPAVVIDINPAMMQFVRGVIRGVDPDGAASLEGLRSIRLRVYHDAEENTRQFNSFIDSVAEELDDEGWQTVMSTQDEQTKIGMYTLMDGEEIGGLTMMLTDGREAVFINVDGTLRAEDLGAALGTLSSRGFIQPFGLPTTVPPSQPAVPSAE